MKNLSSWLIVMFILMYWLFRIIVAVTGSMELDFVTKPINNNIEIILLFVVLACVPLIFKRKLIGAIIYLLSYGGYFGKWLIENVINMVNNEEILSIEAYTDMFFALIGIVLPIVALFDILFDKTRKANPKDKKTDWFYKNEQYDRKLDDRADKNNYKTL